MKTFYKIVSILFMPLLLPTYGSLLLFQTEDFAYLNSTFKLITIAGTILFTLVLPIIPILIMRKKGIISDFSISKREERVAPYLFSFLGFVFWAFFLYRTLGMPGYVSGLGIGSAIALFIILIVNLRWKISAHLAGMGGIAGGIFGVCLTLGLNPTWLFIVVIFLSLLVALARIELKAHTPLQTLAGFIVGFLSVLLCTLYL